MNKFGDMNIFVDASYLIYFSVFGAANRWKKGYPERFNQRIGEPSLEPPDITTDDKYIHCLQSAFEVNMDKIFNTIKTKVFDGFQPPGLRPRIYIVFDADSSTYWRKELFPDYKGNRKSTLQAFNVHDAFKYVKQVIIPKVNMDSYYGVSSIEVDRAEGDDIILTLISRMKHANNVIIGTDHDMVQCFDKCRMFDIGGKEITLDYISAKITKDTVISAKDYLLIKLLMGDQSDGIAGIKKGIGPKRAYKLSKNKVALRTLLEDTPGAAARLKNNSMLIDCKHIPLDIQKEIIQTYKAIRNG